MISRRIVLSLLGLSCLASAPALAEWKHKVRDAWPHVAVEHIDSSGVGDSPELGDVLTVRCVGDDETVTCVLNMGTDTALVPHAGSVMLASNTHVRGAHGTVALPADTAVWLLED